MEDSQLFQQVRDGVPQAFSLLVRRWEPRIYNFVLRYAGDRELAAEICQLTFIRLYKKSRSLRDASKFSTWLYQIALNIARDQLNYRRRWQSVSLDGLEEPQMERTLAGPRPADHLRTQPDRQLLLGNLNDVLSKALGLLPEEQRTVVIMKHYEELKFREIAEILDIPENTVKSRMYYGLAALKKTFDHWKISKESLEV